MIEEGYDLVIRVNPKPNETLVGRAFLRDHLVVVASPTLAMPKGDAPCPQLCGGPPTGQPHGRSNRALEKPGLRSIPFCICRR